VTGLAPPALGLLARASFRIGEAFPRPRESGLFLTRRRSAGQRRVGRPNRTWLLYPRGCWPGCVHEDDSPAQTYLDLPGPAARWQGGPSPHLRIEPYPGAAVSGPSPLQTSYSSGCRRRGRPRYMLRERKDCTPGGAQFQGAWRSTLSDRPSTQLASVVVHELPRRNPFWIYPHPSQCLGFP